LKFICQSQKEPSVPPATAKQPEPVKPVRREPVKPKIPVAEKTPRQKRQAEKKPAPAPLPEEDKRFGTFKLCCLFLGLLIDYFIIM
jgi:hypothetical protein